jgi:NMD protein affecting ribosome stability and mRNA decay
MGEKHYDYFEGILQLRNVDENVVEFALNQFEKNNIGIAKIVELKNGLDIYSASNRFSRKLAKKLVLEFGGELKESPQLFSKSRLTSRNIYRLNVLYTAPEIKKGQVIASGDKIIRVSSIAKHQIRGIDIVSGARATLFNKSIDVLEAKKAIVIKIKPNIEIMQPLTSQIFAPENQKKVKINQEVNYVEYRQKTYIL